MKYGRDYLSDESRLARIGEILARGVANVVNRPPVTPDLVPDGDVTPAVDPETLSVFSAIMKFGKLSPQEIQVRLDASRATANRRISKWEDAGLVQRTGKTTAVTVTLTELGAKTLVSHQAAAAAVSGSICS